MPSKITPENEEKGEIFREMNEMTEADIEAVMEIERKSFDYPWEKKSFIKYIERHSAFVIKNLQNKVIVGYVLIKQKEDAIELIKMATDPDHRRKGYAKFIVEWVKNFAHDKNATRLLLHVRASNFQAIEFYKNMGFEEIQRKENYYTKTGSKPEEKTAIEMLLMC